MSASVWIVSPDTVFAQMISHEFSFLHIACKIFRELDENDLQPSSTMEHCSLLIIDLDGECHQLEHFLGRSVEMELPVILFGYPESESMSADRQRFYDSDISRYVFPRPFLMSQFIYCAKELLQYKEVAELSVPDAPAMKMKQQSPVDDVRLLPDLHSVLFRDTTVTLTKTEYEVFMYLLSKRGTVVKREELQSFIYSLTPGDKKRHDSNLAVVYIRYLRAKLDERFDVRLIETVRGVGYTISLH